VGTASLESLVREWDGLAVLTRHDASSGSWIFIALHDDTLGSMAGGTRLKVYPTPADGLRDAMRLAEGMTHKWAGLDLDYGGGKAVLAVPGPIEGPARRSLLRSYGQLVERLGGLFSTGRDLGTTDEDMLTLAEVTSRVHGVDRTTGTVRDPGPYTASGVFAAMRAALLRLGHEGFAGRSVWVEGVGAVGDPLARMLRESGARVLLSDIDGERCRALGPDEGYDLACDVYAPCAVGGTLNAETIPRLRCRAVTGSANVQLARPEDAERLHERGILYAPDFIANGGGALAFGLIHRGVTDETQIASRLAAIGDVLQRLFEEAGERGESPLATAQRLVRSRLG